MRETKLRLSENIVFLRETSSPVRESPPFLRERVINIRTRTVKSPTP